MIFRATGLLSVSPLWSNESQSRFQAAVGNGRCVGGEGPIAVRGDSGEVKSAGMVVVGGVSSPNEFTPSGVSTVAEPAAVSNTSCATRHFDYRHRHRHRLGENEEGRPWVKLRDRSLT